jgi:multiple sugar transport system ATP-binding protein
MNLVNVTVEQAEGDLFMTMPSTGQDSALRLKVPARFKEYLSPYAGKQIVFGLRPVDIHDSRFALGALDEGENPEDLIAVRTRVDVVEPMGSEVFLYLLHGQNTYGARVDARTEVSPGDSLDVAFNMDKMHAFDPETTESIIDKAKVLQLTS